MDVAAPAAVAVAAGKCYFSGDLLQLLLLRGKATARRLLQGGPVADVATAAAERCC